MFHGFSVFHSIFMAITMNTSMEAIQVNSNQSGQTKKNVLLCLGLYLKRVDVIECRKG